MATTATRATRANRVENYDSEVHYGEKELFKGDSLNHSSSLISSKVVGNALKERVDAVDVDSCHYGGEDSFFVCDLGEVYNQFIRWKKSLPRVDPFYAVKCNGDRGVLRLLANLGVSFDCASKNEIESILNLGVSPTKIVYANTCKSPSYVRYARNVGVKLMTFDNADELYKCKTYYPDSQLLLRIMTDDSSASCPLSLKFGAKLSNTRQLLQLAKDLELTVVGVSFHVGSGSSDPTAFIGAIRNSRTVFEEAFKVGFSRENMSILDIGGGFQSVNFEVTAKIINSSLEEYFFSQGIVPRIIAEPGRYFVADAFTLATAVIGRRWIIEGSRGMLYINDGVYANMNSIMYDHQKPTPRVLKVGKDFVYGEFESKSSKCYEMSVWGPTCDALDCITKNCTINFELNVGDWLYFEEMGAYTLCAGSKFNGFNVECEVIHVCSQPSILSLLE